MVWALEFFEANWKGILAVLAFMAWTGWIFHKGELHRQQVVDVRDAKIAADKAAYDAKVAQQKADFQHEINTQMAEVARDGALRETLRTDQKTTITQQVIEHAKNQTKTETTAALQSGPGSPAVCYGLTDDGLRIVTDAINNRDSQNTGRGDAAVPEPSAPGKQGGT